MILLPIVEWVTHPKHLGLTLWTLLIVTHHRVSSWIGDPCWRSLLTLSHRSRIWQLLVIVHLAHTLWWVSCRASMRISCRKLGTLMGLAGMKIGLLLLWQKAEGPIRVNLWSEIYQSKDQVEHPSQIWPRTLWCNPPLIWRRTSTQIWNMDYQPQMRQDLSHRICNTNPRHNARTDTQRIMFSHWRGMTATQIMWVMDKPQPRQRMLDQIINRCSVVEGRQSHRVLVTHQ